MSEKLRLLMPLRQGGNHPHYYLGAKLPAWLAPNNDNAPEVEAAEYFPWDAINLQIFLESLPIFS